MYLSGGAKGGKKSKTRVPYAHDHNRATNQRKDMCTYVRRYYLTLMRAQSIRFRTIFAFVPKICFAEIRRVSTKLQ